MHVAGVLIFAGRRPPMSELLSPRRVAAAPRAALPAAARVRCRSARARPCWVDDERFDLRYHVRARRCPRPGSEYELRVLAGRVFSQQLRRDRPLWEMWLVEGLEGDRFAILSKTHHALVDGVSGLDILSVLFAPDEARRGSRGAPSPRPRGAGLLAEALLERATNAGELVRPLRAAVRRPRTARRRASRRPSSAPARWRGRACRRRRRALQRAPGRARPALHVGARLARRRQGDQERARRDGQRRRADGRRARAAGHLRAAARTSTASAEGLRAGLRAHRRRARRAGQPRDGHDRPAARGLRGRSAAAWRDLVRRCAT